MLGEGGRGGAQQEGRGVGEKNPGNKDGCFESKIDLQLRLSAAGVCLENQFPGKVYRRAMACLETPDREPQHVISWTSDFLAGDCQCPQEAFA